MTRKNTAKEIFANVNTVVGSAPLLMDFTLMDDEEEKVFMVILRKKLPL